GRSWARGEAVAAGRGAHRRRGGRGGAAARAPRHEGHGAGAIASTGACGRRRSLGSRTAPLAAFTAVIVAGVPLARSEQVPDPPAGGAKAGYRFIPLPLYATSPNEGSTYGVMPVLMRVDDAGDVRMI